MCNIDTKLLIFCFWPVTENCFCVDDIEIDEPTNILPSTGKDKKEKKGKHIRLPQVLLLHVFIIVTNASVESKVYFADKRTDKERLFDGASSDAQPKTRTVDEIKAKYRKAGVSQKPMRLYTHKRSLASILNMVG